MRLRCLRSFGAPDASFARAVEVISAIEGDVADGLAEDHFRLQSVFCNGTVGRGEFDHYFVLDRASSRRRVAQMLAEVGISRPAELTRAFDYHFPAPPPLPPPLPPLPPSPSPSPDLASALTPASQRAQTASTANCTHGQASSSRWIQRMRGRCVPRGLRAGRLRHRACPTWASL